MSSSGDGTATIVRTILHIHCGKQFNATTWFLSAWGRSKPNGSERFGIMQLSLSILQTPFIHKFSP